MIKEFIKKFTKEEFLNFNKIIKISQEYYLVTEEIKELSKRTGRQPLFIGRFLGKEGKIFKPSLWLLQKVSEKSDKKVSLYKDSEWKYICEKDVKVVDGQWSVVDSENVEKDVLVVNVFGECLGYGILKNKILKNVFDIGDFLRREKH